MSNTFDVNILVNGNRCKQYQHEGRTYVEAKNGSEYCIEIKNNYYRRIEGVCSIDGLNVLSGKTASEQDTGYIIDSYHSEKIKGFRFSDDEWAIFKFGYKFNGKTYAQSKGDGSDKNCGVIGVRLFYEYEPITYTLHSQWSPNILWTSPHPNNVPIYTTSVGVGGVVPNYTNTTNVQYSCENFSQTKDCASSPLRSANNTKPSLQGNVKCQSLGATEKGFDIGTEPGRREKSKITNVSFSRGYLAHSLDIYYASRESLIEMGVPITNQLKVNLPQSFPDKYCKMPDWWYIKNNE